MIKIKAIGQILPSKSGTALPSPSQAPGSAISPIGLQTGKGASFLQYPFWAQYKRPVPISCNKLNIDENSELKPEISSIFFYGMQ
jgi:hypothetical protein